VVVGGSHSRKAEEFSGVELSLIVTSPAGEAFAAKNCVILARMRWRETTCPRRKSTEFGDAMTCCEAVMEVRIG